MEDTQMGNQEQEEINSLKILIWRMCRQVSPIKINNRRRKICWIIIIIIIIIVIVCYQVE
jgi:hypothetical protein